MQEVKVDAWAAMESKASLSRYSFSISRLQAEEVLIQVRACGICHSDIHLIDNDWWISQYPLVPGHEILGEVVDIGSSVTGIKAGEFVGVGWQRGACGACSDCSSGRDNLCDASLPTCVGHPGGYANYHVSNFKYCFKLPNSMQAPSVAPLFCGGATVFSPLCEFLQGPNAHGAHVGVIGIGGLGHIAIKMAQKMGCYVTAFTSSVSKENEARRLGAREVISSKNTDEISALGRKFDLIINTANVDLEWAPYLRCLRSDGTLCFVGIPPSPLSLGVGDLLSKRLRVAASPIASRYRIEQMLDFCQTHEIRADVETAPMSQVNELLSKVRKNQVHYRGVITA